MRILSLLWAAALLMSPPLLAQATPDWTRIADLTVTRTLALAPGERVVIHHDATKDAGLVAALRAAITKAGGIVSGELVWPVGATAAVYDTMSPPTLAARVAREDSAYLRLMKSANVYLWLHAPSHRDLPRRIEKLIWASGVRTRANALNRRTSRPPSAFPRP